MPGGSVRGNVRERNVAPRDPYNKLSAEEIRLAKTRFADGGMRPCEIAELLRRDKSTMTRLLVLCEARALYCVASAELLILSWRAVDWLWLCTLYMGAGEAGAAETRRWLTSAVLTFHTAYILLFYISSHSKV